MKTLFVSLLTLGTIIGSAHAGFITLDPNQALPRGVSRDDFAIALPRHLLDDRNSALPRGRSMDDITTPLPLAEGHAVGLARTP